MTSHHLTGVFHGAELPYVFGYPLMTVAPEVRADARFLIDIFPYQQADIDYAEFMTDLWANFVKFGYVYICSFLKLPGNFMTFK